VDVGLACRVLGLGRFFLAWFPSLSLEESLPLRRDYEAGAQSPWIDVAWSNHPMWDGVGFTLSLSGGEETPEAVRLALVDTVQVLRGRIVPAMRVDREKLFSPDLKSLESGV
jgi:hypothetical protein